MKSIKIISLLLMFLLIATNNSYAQKRVIESRNHRVRLTYNKKQLKSFYCVDLEVYFLKRYFNRQKYNVEWGEGEVNVFGHNLEYTYRYDTLYRVFEASMYTEWSNHHRFHYMFRKYDSTDYEPKECFYYAKLNYPYEMRVVYDCWEKIDWADVIDYELKERSRFYPKSTVNMNVFRFLEQDAEEEFLNFLFGI